MVSLHHIYFILAFNRKEKNTNLIFFSSSCFSLFLSILIYVEKSGVLGLTWTRHMIIKTERLPDNFGDKVEDI